MSWMTSSPGLLGLWSFPARGLPVPQPCQSRAQGDTGHPNGCPDIPSPGVSQRPRALLALYPSNACGSDPKERLLLSIDFDFSLEEIRPECLHFSLSRGIHRTRYTTQKRQPSSPARSEVKAKYQELSNLSKYLIKAIRTLHRLWPPKDRLKPFSS